MGSCRKLVRPTREPKTGSDNDVRRGSSVTRYMLASFRGGAADPSGSACDQLCQSSLTVELGAPCIRNVCDDKYNEGLCRRVCSGGRGCQHRATRRRGCRLGPQDQAALRSAPCQAGRGGANESRYLRSVGTVGTVTAGHGAQRHTGSCMTKGSVAPELIG
jgi:hypothetical protein